MVRMLGMILIASSLLSLIAGTLIGAEHGGSAEFTGNIVLGILTQPEVGIGFFGYLEAVAFSYSIISLIMGIVFLVRV